MKRRRAVLLSCHLVCLVGGWLIAEFWLNW